MARSIGKKKPFKATMNKIYSSFQNTINKNKLKRQQQCTTTKLLKQLKIQYIKQELNTPAHITRI